MNNEERDLISKFVARVGGAAQGGFGSVPSTRPNLPAIDPEADNFIAQQFQQYPEARYRITQMAVVQEAALVEAQNRIQQLQFQLQQAQQQLQQAQQQKPASGGFFGGLFGGGQRPQQAQQTPPGWGGNPGTASMPPQYQPQPMPYGMQPGMFQRGGTGFLGSALTTATGVAGGMLAANALTSLFSDHHGAAGAGDGGWGAGAPQNETIINNYGDSADPFAGQGTTADPNFDAGGNDWGSQDSGGDFGGDWGDDNF